jgi:hypothetical protein
MQPPEGYKVETLWSDVGGTVRPTRDIREEVIQFWLAERALRTRPQAEQRANQVILVAWRDQRVVAVATCYRQRVEMLNHDFYSFRCFVGRAHRQHNLGAVLIVQARDFLNERFRRGEDPDVIGMHVVVENEKLMKMRNQAVWPISKFVYIGRNERGQHLRVYYFDGARV